MYIYIYNVVPMNLFSRQKQRHRHEGNKLVAEQGKEKGGTKWRVTWKDMHYIYTKLASRMLLYSTGSSAGALWPRGLRWGGRYVRDSRRSSHMYTSDWFTCYGRNQPRHCKTNYPQLKKQNSHFKFPMP